MHISNISSGLIACYCSPKSVPVRHIIFVASPGRRLMCFLIASTEASLDEVIGQIGHSCFSLFRSVVKTGQ